MKESSVAGSCTPNAAPMAANASIGLGGAAPRVAERIGAPFVPVTKTGRSSREDRWIVRFDSAAWTVSPNHATTQAKLAADIEQRVGQRFPHDVMCFSTTGELS